MVIKVNASHILLKKQSEATSVYYDVTHGGDFSDIAKARSICSSRKKGGNLGWFSRGQMVKEFETKAFSMQKGEISGPVRTKFGYHIIKINDMK